MFLKLGAINVHYKRNKLHPWCCCYSNYFRSCVFPSKNQISPFTASKVRQKGPTWNRQGHLAALTRSHLIGDHPSRLTKEQTTETMDPSPKTQGLRPYPRQWNLVLVGAARLPERFGGFSCWLLLEGLLLGVVHSVNRHILFLRNRKPLSFSSKNRHRPTGRTIILITDLLTARSKFFAIC